MFCLGIGHGASTSTVDLDIEAASETECRDRGLGGTVEIDTDESLLETPMMSRTNMTGDSSCPLWLRKELEDAEFIPMPDDPMQSNSDQLSSFSESVTLPYEELRELKAAAAALSTKKDLPTMRMGCSRVNGVEEIHLHTREECSASHEVIQLHETVAQQDMRIQILEKQVSEQKKENERLWAAISRLSNQKAGFDANGNHHSDQMPGDGGGRGAGYKNYGGRSAGASV